MTAAAEDASIEEGEIDRELAARAALYSLAARAFEHPDERFHAAARDGRLRTEAETYVRRSRLSIEVPEFDPDAAYDDLAARYNGLFQLGHARYTDRTDGSLDSEGPPVPLYESKYRDAAWSDVNVDLARAYDHFGAGVADDERDHHDNLRLELAFAAYLTRREAVGDDAAADARRDLIDRHLDPFTEGLCDRLDTVEGGFYAALARLTRRIVTADRAVLGGAADG